MLRGFLDDLARLQPPSLKRLIVTCNTPEVVEMPPEIPFVVEVVHNPAPAGFGRNHNAAFAKCQEPYFAVCNPDVRLLSDPFPVLLDALDAGYALAAPAVIDRHGKRADSARSLLTPFEVLMRAMGRRRAEFNHPAWLAGMFLVFRSDAFRRLGGFDKKFFLYCEDADISARTVLYSSGFAYCSQATVVHDARRASRSALRPLLWHLSSLLKFWLSPTFWLYWRHLRSANVRPTVFRSESPEMALTERG